MNPALYIILVSHNSFESTLRIVEEFNYAMHLHYVKCQLIIIENGDMTLLHEQDAIARDEKIIYHYVSNPNKARAINYAIAHLIKESDALVLCIDDDISFKPNFFKRFYEESLLKNYNYYFGGGLLVKKPNSYNLKIQDYYQPSTLGRSDAEFTKIKNPTFFGCNYGFYKSQWRTVGGLDERFAPGAVTGLKGDESVFQQKLKSYGYLPHYIKDNLVKHLPDHQLYHLNSVINRQYDNAFTHGYQMLILEKKITPHFKKTIYLIKRIIIQLVKFNYTDVRIKYSYFKGHLKSFIYYLTAKNNTSYLS